MSHCESLQNKLAMCPCSEGNDIQPKEQNGGIENDQNFGHVENGFDVIFPSSDSGSDEEVDNLAAQGYISLPQCEDDAMVSNDIAQVICLC